MVHKLAGSGREFVRMVGGHCWMAVGMAIIIVLLVIDYVNCFAGK